MPRSNKKKNNKKHNKPKSQPTQTPLNAIFLKQNIKQWLVAEPTCGRANGIFERAPQTALSMLYMFRKHIWAQQQLRQSNHGFDHEHTNKWCMLTADFGSSPMGTQLLKQSKQSLGSMSDAGPVSAFYEQDQVAAREMQSECVETNPLNMALAIEFKNPSAKRGSLCISVIIDLLEAAREICCLAFHLLQKHKVRDGMIMRDYDADCLIAEFEGASSASSKFSKSAIALVRAIESLRSMENVFSGKWVQATNVVVRRLDELVAGISRSKSIDVFRIALRKSVKFQGTFVHQKRATIAGTPSVRGEQPLPNANMPLLQVHDANEDKHAAIPTVQKKAKQPLGKNQSSSEDDADEKEPKDAADEKEPKYDAAEKEPKDDADEKEPKDDADEKEPKDDADEKEPKDDADEKESKDDAAEKSCMQPFVRMFDVSVSCGASHIDSLVARDCVQLNAITTTHLPIASQSAQQKTPLTLQEFLNTFAFNLQELPSGEDGQTKKVIFDTDVICFCVEANGLNASGNVTETISSLAKNLNKSVKTKAKIPEACLVAIAFKREKTLDFVACFPGILPLVANEELEALIELVVLRTVQKWMHCHAFENAQFHLNFENCQGALAQNWVRKWQEKIQQQLTK